MEGSVAPRVSIIVLFMPGSRWVERCIDALRQSVPETVQHELIIVANGFAGEAPPPMHGPELRLLRSAVNLGFGGGCNWAAHHARGEFLIFLNDDAIVEHGWVEPLLEAAETDPGVGAAGSVVLAPDGEVEEAGRVVWCDGTSHPIRLRHGEADESPVAREVDYCSACSLLVRRRAWDEIGGFDERYFPAYYEDSDLAMQLRARGWKVVCAPRSVVHHHRSASTDPMWRRFLGLRNHRLFVQKWRDALAIFPQRPRDDPRASEIYGAARAARSRREALYDLTVSQRGRPSLPPRGDPPRGDATPERLALLEQEVTHLMAELQVKDDYIAHLGATRPEMQRALSRVLTGERRSIRRREFIKGLPVVGPVLHRTLHRVRRWRPPRP